MTFFKNLASIKNQFLTHQRLLNKFLFSSLGLVINLMINVFAASYLGPDLYGQYGFAIAAGSFITQIAMVTLPETYVYFLSANVYSLSALNRAYLTLMSAVTILAGLLFALSIYQPTLHSILWPHSAELNYLILGFVYMILINAQQSLTKYGDCLLQHDKVEKLRFLSRLMGLLFIVALWQLNLLTLKELFYALNLSLILFFIFFSFKLPFPLTENANQQFKSALVSLYQGWNPISCYTLLCALYIFAGRYGIQVASGAKEQGYFTYALFLAMLPIGALTPMITLYMSHMARYYSQGLNDVLINHFMKITHLAIIFYGMFSFALITNTAPLLHLLQADIYSDAIPVLQWLAAYSFLNLFDLLGGNLYFCTERTQQYRHIFSLTSLAGIVIIFLLYQFHTLSAYHLAIVTTLVLALQVSLHLIGNVRFLKLSFAPLLLSYAVTLASTLSAGFIINAIFTDFYTRLACYLLTTIIFTSIRRRDFLYSFP